MLSCPARDMCRSQLSRMVMLCCTRMCLHHGTDTDFKLLRFYILLLGNLKIYITILVTRYHLDYNNLTNTPITNLKNSLVSANDPDPMTTRSNGKYTVPNIAHKFWGLSFISWDPVITPLSSSTQQQELLSQTEILE